MSVSAGQDVLSRKETLVARSSVDVTGRSRAAYTAVTVVDADKLRLSSSRHSTSGSRHVPGGGAGKRAHRIVAAALRIAADNRLRATVAVAAADSTVVGGRDDSVLTEQQRWRRADPTVDRWTPLRTARNVFYGVARKFVYTTRVIVVIIVVSEYNI